MKKNNGQCNVLKIFIETPLKNNTETFILLNDIEIMSQLHGNDYNVPDVYYEWIMNKASIEQTILVSHWVQNYQPTFKYKK